MSYSSTSCVYVKGVLISHEQHQQRVPPTPPRDQHGKMVQHFPGAFNAAKFSVNDLECNTPVKSALHLKDHAENSVCVCVCVCVEHIDM